MIAVYAKSNRLEKLQTLEKWISEKEPGIRTIIEENIENRKGRRRDYEYGREKEELEES